MSSDAQERHALRRAFWFAVWAIVRVYACFRPKVTIYLNGASYLTRWFLTSTPEPGKTGTPGWYLHHIHVADADRRQHNHPWLWARTRVVRGWYVELRDLGYPDRTWREPGDGYELTGDTYHRITDVSPGGVWSLFHAGPKHGKGWGPR